MSDRPQHEGTYLHVRAPRRVVGVGGEGMASSAGYRETDERRFELFFVREPREPEKPDRSMFA